MVLSNDPEWLSPVWLEKKLNGAIAAAYWTVKTSFRRPWISAPLVFIAALFSLYAVGWLAEFSILPNLHRYNAVYSKRLAVFAATFVFAALVPQRKLVYTGWFRALTIAAVSAYAAFVVYSGEWIWAIGAEVLLVSALVWFNVMATARWAYGKRWLALVLSFLVSFFLPALIYERTGESFVSPLFFFPAAYTVLLSIVLVRAQAAGRLSRQRNWDLLTHAFSPILLVEPMPLPPSVFPQAQASSERTAEERADAFTSLFAGWLWLAVSIGIHEIFLSDRAEHSFFDLRHGWFIYIYYYFFWMGLLRFGYATGRIFGYKIPVPCEQALLAANPRERWRRWNIYLYNFMFQQVFFPIMKRTRSVALAVSAVFALDFALHNVGPLNSLFSRGHFGWDFIYFLGGEIVFYALHSLSLMVGLWTDRWWPSSHSRRGWWGVILTQVFMAITHSAIHHI